MKTYATSRYLFADRRADTWSLFFSFQLSFKIIIFLYCLHKMKYNCCWVSFSVFQNWNFYLVFRERKRCKGIHRWRRHFVPKISTKWREILKCYIFWMDKYISQIFPILTPLRWVLSETTIRYPIILQTKFGGNFVTSFSSRKCQNLKNIKTNVLWNGEFYIVAKFQVNCVKT